jgi:hypothetical protein
MSSELEVLRQRITKLETENAEIPELRKKFAEVEAKNVELEDEKCEAQAGTREPNRGVGEE